MRKIADGLTLQEAKDLVSELWGQGDFEDVDYQKGQKGYEVWVEDKEEK